MCLRRLHRPNSLESFQYCLSILYLLFICLGLVPRAPLNFRIGHYHKVQLFMWLKYLKLVQVCMYHPNQVLPFKFHLYICALVRFILFQHLFLVIYQIEEQRLPYI